MKAYEEIIDFLASGTTPRGISLFKASESTKQRVRELLNLEKQGTATSVEKTELDDYLRLEHLMRLTKARAKNMPSRSDYISESTRRLVEKRANSHCEYCLIHEEDTYIGCEIDHIISIKHGGKNDETNLALSCLSCNRFKGTDIASLTEKGEITRFYNPRIDNWLEHFQIIGNMILGITDIGKVTVKILRINDEERLEEREYLQDMGLFPK